tara:strand:- start:790 stop:1200 length:411 start_codon:yes stop_codon:yes gene_type:complete
MKKSDFKDLIKESVKEVLIDEGVLKSVISEVVKAVGLVQSETAPTVIQESFTQQVSEEAAENQRQKIMETKKKMLNAIGNSSYGGVDLFEGTTPLRKGGGSDPSPASALEGVDPGDPGVDISSLVGGANVWKQLIK